MVATVSVRQCIGTTPSTASISNLRLNVADTIAPAGTTNPLRVPSSGIVRSFTKTIFLNADTSPDSSIQDVILYGDGGALGWSGATLYFGSNVSYIQANGSISLSGADSIVAVNNFISYVSASPYTANGSIANPNTGRMSDYIQFQMDIDTNALKATLTPKNIIFGYTEV